MTSLELDHPRPSSRLVKPRPSGRQGLSRGPGWVCCVLATAAAACGSEGPDAGSGPEGALQVAAFPSGRSFEGDLRVRLESNAPAVIQYTLDGTSPAESTALVYDGPIELNEGTLLTFVALDDHGRWSSQGSELYERRRPVEPYRPPERGFELSDDLLFFSASLEDEVLEEQVSLRSVGLAPVDVSSIYIAPSGGYFEDGVFEIIGPMEARVAPGDELHLTVRYHATDTLRTGALVLITNGLRAPDGVWVIGLGGRRSEL